MQNNISIEACIDTIIQQAGKKLIVGLPLGLGKPAPLINALYARAKKDNTLSLTICTALSLEIPAAKSELERRFLEPFAKRFFEGVPELDYARDRRANKLPDNVEVIEFYFSPGALLGNEHAQQNYISSNYTHAARDLLDRGLNVVLQMVAIDESVPDKPRYSLSCNPDLTLDIMPALRAQNSQAMLVGMVNRQLPYMPNDAQVADNYFDAIVDVPEGNVPLFAMPNPLAGDSAHAVGLYASTLVRDGGTLQVGIGDLGDAFAHAVRLRHTDNNAYRAALQTLNNPARFNELAERDGGLDPFSEKLYGASEMFTNGMLKLYQADVLTRRVYEDEAVQHRANAGEKIEPGEAEAHVLHGAFFLGPPDFYQALRDMPSEEKRLFNMTAVSKVNQLYGDEDLERLQRQHARFVNTCMKVTLNGAAASDTVAGGGVVSGVGGQYNFVAMAHALDNARSIILLRSTRTNSSGKLESNIVPDYSQCTIPRHLRDIVITEYGIADLRGKTDTECAEQLICIADSHCQASLIKAAQAHGKLPKNYQVPDWAKQNTAENLHQKLNAFRSNGTLPDFPLGTDFTPEEQQLAAALTTLKKISAGWRGKLRLTKGTITHGQPTPAMQPALQRMALAQPKNLKERFLQRIVSYALSKAM